MKRGVNYAMNIVNGCVKILIKLQMDHNSCYSQKSIGLKVVQCSLITRK